MLILVRKYNAKCYLAILTSNKQVFHDVKYYLVAAKIYNVYVFRRGYNMISYAVYGICAFCKNGLTALMFNDLFFKTSCLKQIRFHRSVQNVLNK